MDKDFLNNQRDSNPDMGAFEFVGSTPSPTSSPQGLLPCFGSNQIIDTDDVQVWTDNYLTNNLNLDINGDQSINSFEFGYLLSHWNETCQP